MADNDTIREMLADVESVHLDHDDPMINQWVQGEVVWLSEIPDNFLMEHFKLSLVAVSLRMAGIDGRAIPSDEVITAAIKDTVKILYEAVNSK